MCRGLHRLRSGPKPILWMFPDFLVGWAGKIILHLLFGMVHALGFLWKGWFSKNYFCQKAVISFNYSPGQASANEVIIDSLFKAMHVKSLKITFNNNYSLSIP